MEPTSVVEPFQVLEGGTPRHISIGEAAPMHEFGLQGSYEALRHGVVQSGSGPSHRRNDADLRKALAERDRRVLDAAIGVMHEAGNRSASPYRHLQGVDHELCPHVRGHRPTDDLARMGVQDEGQIEEAFPSRYVRDVRQPDPVGPTSHEFPAKQIWCGSNPRVAASGSTLLAPNTASKPRGSH